MGRLSQGFVDSTRKVGRYGDGRGGYGLSLLVKRAADGGMLKTYQQTLRTDCGRYTTIGLGRADGLKLREARSLAVDNWRQGPRSTVCVPPHTFADAVEGLLRMKVETNKTDERTAHLARMRITRWCGDIADLPVADVSRQNVLEALRKAQHVKSVVGRLRRELQEVFNYAILVEWRTAANPAGDEVLVALPRPPETQHHAAIPYTDLAAALPLVESGFSWPLSRLCVRFLALTAVRSNEARKARWDEVDLDARTWTIPAERMKMSRAHRVPLSSAAVAMLTEAKALCEDLGDVSGLCFPSQSGKAIVGTRISEVFRLANVGGTPHGLRSAFRDWAAETGEDDNAAEAALAHQRGDATQKAYLRTDYFMKRVPLMEKWAQVVNGTAPVAEVVSFPGRSERIESAVADL